MGADAGRAAVVFWPFKPSTCVVGGGTCAYVGARWGFARAAKWERDIIRSGAPLPRARAGNGDAPVAPAVAEWLSTHIPILLWV